MVLQRNIQRGYTAFALVAVVTVFIWFLISSYQQPELYLEGPLNVPLVYQARLMPYVIDYDGSCVVPEWLGRGVYVAQKECQELQVVDYGGTSRWSETSSANWTFSQLSADPDAFIHALMECEKGSHMTCMIMDVSKGPFHTVEDPLAALTKETLAWYTNELTVYRCGKSYKDCVVIPSSIVEPLVNRHYESSFDDGRFKTVVKQADFKYRKMVW
ncbi:hypothetical protein CJU90_3809 [Yarrowia sp. C11]|nr:hypothetical protein CKK34_5419 [Yarrowia sp. E02]KAG5367511.1 hypothetical protein CJU90_3809 [Yarrowia sp. C11]